MPYLTAVQQLPRGAVNTLATFHVFVEPGRAPTGFETMLARAIQVDSASGASLKVAATWYQECLASHQKCTRMLAQKRLLPTRVLDVGDASRNPRLIVTDGQSGSWATLSYCWVGDSNFVFNEKTSDSLFGGKVSLCRFPKTLQDAIIITRALSLRFLWIDALSKMTYEPLNTRGWTLQESLLSPPTLSYGTQQMFWECLECKHGENGRLILLGERYRDKIFMQTVMANNFGSWEKAQQVSTRLSLKTLPVDWKAVPESWVLKRDAMYSRWFAIVKDYAGRNLIVQSDILPATSGLARAFRNLLRDKYCAGLWRNDIIREMCWQRTRLLKRDFRAIRAGQRERDHCLPSWSWASVIGGRVFNILEDEQLWPINQLKETAQILRERTIPKNKDAFGQTAHAEIVVKAPFQYIDDPTIDDPTIETPKSKSTDLPVLRDRVRQEIQIDTEESEQQHRSYRGHKFAVLRLMHTSSRLAKISVNGKDQH